MTPGTYLLGGVAIVGCCGQIGLVVVEALGMEEQ